MSDTQRLRYADVRDRLLATLGRERPELRTRGTDDFAVAMVDTWAVLAEILGFASARLHEESALDLAVHRDSVVELTRILGYQPDPGVAAIASLAFTLEDAPGAPRSTRIPVGTAAMSTPLPGEVPVTFETVEEVEARPAWNAVRPCQGTLQQPGTEPRTLVLAGTATNLMPGDGVLVPDGVLVAGAPTQGRWGVVTAVTTRPAVAPSIADPGRAGTTVVQLELAPGSKPIPPATLPPLPPGARAPGPPLAALLAGGTTALDDTGVRAAASGGGYPESELFAALRDARVAAGSVLVFRQQTGILGSGAPEWNALPESLRNELTGTGATAPTPARGSSVHVAATAASTTGSGSHLAAGSTVTPIVLGPIYTTTLYVVANTLVWAEDSLELYPGATAGQPGGARRVFCDVVVKGLGPGLVLLRDGATWGLYGCTAVAATSKSVFTVTGRSTALTLSTGGGSLDAFSIRGTSVHLVPEWLELAPQPAPSELPGGTAGSAIPLDDWVEGLHAGQRVAITGRLHAVPGTVRSHVTTITKVSHGLTATGTTTIELRDALPAGLLRESVTINGNVTEATHGETRTEVLGNSDGRDPHPAYRLAGKPLTHVTTTDGSRPELRVYVAGVLRPRVPALLDEDEQGYVLREDESGATVVFGSALPTGVATVRAVYRTGLGAAARVRAGQLDLLTVRPPGVRSVTNPLPAEGGADPETPDRSRRTAPASTRSLDRPVSLRDYEDIAAAFPGIAKAMATWTTSAGRRGVLVSVAAEAGNPVAEGGTVQQSLSTALAGKGDPDVPVEVHSYRPVDVRVAARLRVDPTRLADEVVAAARYALADALGFERRDLGQSVSESEVLSVLHAVPGVVSANLTELRRVVAGTAEGAQAVQPFLRAETPVGGTVAAAAQTAELLSVDPKAPASLVVVP